MKNYFQKFNKILILTITIIVIMLLILVNNINNRYKISSPMDDIEYKTAIIKQSGNIFYKLENLRPVVGENELTEFIKNNNDNPQIYTPTTENINNGTFKANLHMHTICSDGVASVKKRLDDAQSYAQKISKNVYIAITDHNTVNGAKEVVKVLQKNPNKYPNVKVILGMEVYTGFRSKYSDKPVEVHVLTYCINPYDKFLNKEFFKPIHADKWNRKLPDRDFDKLIGTMRNYSIPGIAHPIRYTNHLKDNKFLYINEIFERYKNINTKISFTEGYYQAYPRYYKEYETKELQNFMKYIIEQANKHNIYNTGSTDSHSSIIFN